MVATHTLVAAAHAVTELVSGGELFDRIVNKGHYPEPRAKVCWPRLLAFVLQLLCVCLCVCVCACLCDASNLFPQLLISRILRGVKYLHDHNMYGCRTARRRAMYFCVYMCACMYVCVCVGTTDGRKLVFCARRVHRDLKPENIILDGSDETFPKSARGSMRARVRAAREG
jgi:serine/threonine protein kinase